MLTNSPFRRYAERVACPLRVWASACLTAFWLIAPVDHAHAAENPVLIALDASMSTDRQADAKSIIVALIRGQADVGRVGLVIFDDVIQSAVSLEHGADGKLSLIDGALDGLIPSYSSSLAAGFERALAELDGRGTAHLMIFARATLGSADAGRELRNRQWVTDVLLPDAAEQGVAITLIAPEADADQSLLDAITSYSMNQALVLNSESTLIDHLRVRMDADPLSASQ